MKGSRREVAVRKTRRARFGTCGGREIDTIDRALYTGVDGMGKQRRHAKQASMWVAVNELHEVRTPSTRD
jgi:hypothetical protein